MATLSVNVNTSYATGASGQLGIVPTHILPGVIMALRARTKMIKFISKDYSNEIAKYGDAVAYEKLTGSPSIVNLATTPVTYSKQFTFTYDRILLDRYIGIPFRVDELEQLLPINAQSKWDSFIKATVYVLDDYIEADVAGLHASMTNGYDITGGLSKNHFPILEDQISHNSKDDPGPWIFLVSRGDFLNLTSDNDLRDLSYTGTMNVLRQANIFQLANINAIRWRHIPEVAITSPSGYSKLYHNILMNSRAIQILPRRLGVPKMSTNTSFFEWLDEETGLIFRMRVTFDGESGQAGWNILLEILYGIKLMFTEYAMDVTTMHA